MHITPTFSQAYPDTFEKIAHFLKYSGEDLGLHVIFFMYVTYHADYEEVSQNISKLCGLSLVCKKWNLILSSPQIGNFVSIHLGLPFSALSWKEECRLHSNFYFTQDNRPQPKESIFSCSAIRPSSFSSNSFEMRQRVCLIDKRGIIFYRRNNNCFDIFLFENPEEIIHVNTPSNLVSLSYFNETIFCSGRDGTITGFSLKDLKEPLFTKQLHADPVLGFFLYQKGWISISQSEIIFYDPNTLEQKLLKQITPDSFCSLDYTFTIDLECSNHFLLFNFVNLNGGKGDSFLFSIKDPQNGFFKIDVPYPKYTPLNIWNHEICILSFEETPEETPDGQICKATCFPLTYFREGCTHSEKMVKKEVSWCIHKEDMLVARFFRGNHAFFVIADRDRNFKIQLIDLRDDKKVVWEHSDPLLDWLKGCFVNGNQFIYLRTDQKIVVLDF